MKDKSMARLSWTTKKEIKKHKVAPNESYDNILQRLLGLRREPKQFKFKEVKK